MYKLKRKNSSNHNMLWCHLLLNKWCLILLFVICSMHMLYAQLNINISTVECDKIATEMLEALANNDFMKSTEHYNAQMKAGFTPQQAEAVWKQTQAAIGKFVSMQKSQFDTLKNYIIVTKNIVFEKDSLSALITFEQNPKTNKIEIAGFYFRPIPAKEVEYEDAEYVDNSKFERIAITLPKDNILKGELTIQTDIPGSQKVPCVVLVHGSGPNDMDETIFSNKPFRDIAFGLASRGIATLRYNKRTLVDKNLDAKNLTLNEETVFDAVEAVNFLRTNYPDKIDKIYVLGHSLGGFAMPRIAKLANNAAGFISLAGAARWLGDVLVEQYDYLFSLNKQDIITAEQGKIIDNAYSDVMTKALKIKHKQFNLNTPNDSLPTGLTAHYLMDLKDYEPAKEFAKETRPRLFIQGKRDYQVTTEDFNIWQQTLGKKPNCKFVLLDNLNHLLQAGEGKSTPSEYSKKQNVDKQVIDEIEKWIKN